MARNVQPEWRRPRRRRPWWKKSSFVLVALPLAVFGAVLAAPQGWPPGAALEIPIAGAGDSESARFTVCLEGARANCVIDGDTFWYGGEKIRIADINTPEVSEPQCAAEARLGHAATQRLQSLLNAGAFSLEAADRDRDQYGRLLRTVTRGGESLGDTLVAEGLAEQWQGYRREWC